MRVKKILFFTAFIILLIGMLYVCQGETYVTTNDEENIIIESEEISTDIMKVISNTAIYESKETNNNPIGTLTTGSMVKRINHEVNEMNGHI